MECQLIALNPLHRVPRSSDPNSTSQVRDTLKCIVSRANRVGMMFAPIRYSHPDMFRNLAKDTTLEGRIAYPPEDEMQAFLDAKVRGGCLGKRGKAGREDSEFRE